MPKFMIDLGLPQLATRPRFHQDPSLLGSMRFAPQVVFDAENGSGTGGDDDAAKAAKEAADKAAADKAAADKAERERLDAEERRKAGISDKEADLLKEVMAKKDEITKLKEQVKKFEGIDPEQVKKLVEKAEAEAAAAKKAEEKRLAEAGDFDRLKAMMKEQHEKELKDAQEAAGATKSALDQAMSTINELTVGSSFANSAFIAEQTVLPAAAARSLYGNHFDVEDGKLIPFDKPKGAKERTPLVDARGEPLSFEAAIQKLVEMSPDRDKLLRSKMAPGAGSSTTTVRSQPTLERKGTDGELRGKDRMIAALNKGALAKKK